MLKTPRRKTTRIATLLVALLVLTDCGGSKPENDRRGGGRPGGGRPGAGAGMPEKKPIPVEVQLPELGLASSSYATTATLEPSSDAEINARATGVVRELLSEEGDYVEAGQILLRLEDDDQRLRVKRAQQDLDSAKREYDRLVKMREGLVSSTDMETAESTFNQAETELELAELALSYTRIAAPFSGRVVWREVDLGAHVRDGAMLFRMMAIKPLLVRVHIPANRMGTVAVGQAVSLQVDSVGQVLTGTIDLVSPIVDPNTGTVKVTVVLDDYPEGVRPGDFAEIEIVTAQRDNALLLPSTAVIEERGQHILYLADGDKASRREVEIGFVVGDKTEIVSGLEAGAQVVVKGQRNLSEGAIIEDLTNADTSADAPAKPGPEKRRATP
jgi:membrane fusion protein (multidrug efflux system)